MSRADNLLTRGLPTCDRAGDLTRFRLVSYHEFSLNDKWNTLFLLYLFLKKQLYTSLALRLRSSDANESDSLIFMVELSSFLSLDIITLELWSKAKKSQQRQGKGQLKHQRRRSKAGLSPVTSAILCHPWL